MGRSGSRPWRARCGCGPASATRRRVSRAAGERRPGKLEPGLTQYPLHPAVPLRRRPVGSPCRRCGTGHDGTLRRVSPSGLATRPLSDRELPRASATAASVFALLGGGHLHMGVGGGIVVPSVLAHAIAAAAGPVTHTLASAQALEDNADGTVTNRYTMMTGLSEMAMSRSVPVRPLIGRTPAPAPIR